MKVKVYKSSRVSCELRYKLAGKTKRETVRVEDVESRVEEIETYLDNLIIPLSRDEATEYHMAKKLLGERSLVVAVVEWLAEQEAKKSEAEVCAPKMFRVVVARYIQDMKSRGLAEETTTVAFHTLRHFAEKFDGKDIRIKELPGSFLIARVTGNDVRSYLDGSRSPKTYNNKRATLHAFFTWTDQMGYLTSNVINGIKPKKIKVKDPVPFTPTEFRKLVRQAVREERTDLVAILGLGGLAGIRMAEISRLNWGDIIEDERVYLSSHITKTNRRRSVTMNPQLHNILGWVASVNAAAPKEELIVNTKNKNRDLKALASRAGVDWKSNGLRKGFVSYGCQIRNMNDVAREAGHSLDTLQTYYQGLVSDKDAEEWFSNFPLISGS